MQNLQEDKLNMCYSVKSTCDKFQPTWTTNTVFSATFQAFNARLPLIEQNRDAQIIENTGVTTDKQTKRAIMTDKALYISGRLKSYATVTANSELLESVDYTTSDMKRARDTEIIGICDAIVSKANANVANLTTYGVTAALVTDLVASISSYSATLSKPRTTKAQTKNATENLVVLFKEVDDILINRLDLDIEMFKVSKPDFYSQYKTSRVIISLGATSSSILGSAIDVNNGDGIKHVEFIFTPTVQTKGMTTSNNHSSISKKTAKKGKFRIPSMTEGSYTVTVKKLGYKTQTLSINVVDNETTSIDVELEKE